MLEGVLFASGMRSKRSESTTSIAYINVDTERAGRRGDFSVPLLVSAGHFSYCIIVPVASGTLGKLGKSHTDAKTRTEPNKYALLNSKLL